MTLEEKYGKLWPLMEVRKYLKLSRSGIYSRVKRGEIKTLKIGDKLYVKDSDVQGMLQ